MGAKTMRKTTTEMRKRTEANARRRVSEAWARAGKRMSYKRAAGRETYRHTTDEMKDELFDGILISLSPRNSHKGTGAQMRVLRSIAEKRQAQAAYRYIGRSDDLLTERITSACGKNCMRELRRYQMCM